MTKGHQSQRENITHRIVTNMISYLLILYELSSADTWNVVAHSQVDFN